MTSKGGIALEEQSTNIFGRIWSFIKANLDMVSKLVANHIGMMVFGLIVIISCSMISSRHMDGGGSWLVYIVTGVAVLVYLCLLYTAMWEKGASDKVKIDGGRLKKKKLYGLWVWLIANSINVILCLIVEIISFANGDGGILEIIVRYYNAMYLGLTNAIDIPFIYIIIQLPGLITCTVSYLLGVNGFRCIFPEPKGERNRKQR